MNDAFLIGIVVLGGLVTAQNAFVGYSTGKIEMRSFTIERSQQPTLFWFVFVTEILFLFGAFWLLVGFLTGEFRLEGQQ